MKLLFTLSLFFIITFCQTEDPVIGIDLGTTFSVVGVYKNGKVEIIANDQGNRITPSVVSFLETGERLIGESAKNQASLNPTNTVYDSKRLIGKEFQEENLQEDLKLLPFKVVNQHGKPVIELNVKGEKKLFSPEEVSSMVLTKMKEIAESYLGKKVKKAVITVPAYFNNAQRKATVEAGKIAGLEVMRVLNEPTAAAIAYGFHNEQKDKHILVFDLGGGTFDVSLLNIDDGVFEVLATSGDTHLGGEDFDQRVMKFLISEFKKQTGQDCSSDKKSLQKLRRESEKAKILLSQSHEARIEIEALYKGLDFSYKLSRAKFEELNDDLFKKTIVPVETVLRDAKIPKTKIDEIVLVGGSSRIPKIQQLLKELFNGKEPTKGINPDEAVAYGAAIQAASLNGDKDMQLKEFVVINVTPLSLGIETVGGVMTKIIERNQQVPTTKKQVFSTYQDSQPAVSIRIFEGERALTKDNNLLGQFDLTGIPPAPRGVPQIEVSFSVDGDGILNVEAKDLGTSNSKNIQIKNTNSRSQEELDKMINEAQKYAEEDQKLKEKINQRNELESYIFQVKSSINDKEKVGNKISEDEIKSIQSNIDETSEWLSKNPSAEIDEYKSKKSELEKVVFPILSKLYQNKDQTQAKKDEL